MSDPSGGEIFFSILGGVGVLCLIVKGLKDAKEGEKKMAAASAAAAARRAGSKAPIPLPPPETGELFVSIDQLPLEAQEMLRPLLPKETTQLSVSQLRKLTDAACSISQDTERLVGGHIALTQTGAVLELANTVNDLVCGANNTAPAPKP